MVYCNTDKLCIKGRKDKKMSEKQYHGAFASQVAFLERVRQWNAAYEQETGKKRKYFCFTMGCQMNAHDSEKIVGMLEEMGYEATQAETEADFVIYNTCCIRENAEQKVYGKLGWLHHLKRTKPELIVALCGCMVQQETVLEKLHRSYRHVDLIFGTHNLYKLPELLDARIESGSPICDIWQEQGEIVEDLPSHREHAYKAAVNIMYGCNNFCSYCIVPYVRGRERSREMADILAEVEALVKDGVKEIMFLGQNVNSYGKTLSPQVTFAQLLRETNKIEGLERIRFMTSHPKDLSDELICAMAECEKVCRYLHLPVQSGSSRVLKEMNRRYTKEQYLALVEKIKAAIPDIFLSTDIIVGFPGETEEDFQETLDVVRKVGYSTAFTFLYSKRTGTPAAVMENQVEEAVAHDRFDRLLDVLNPKIHDIHSGLVGKVLPVLAEEVSRQGENMLSGRTEQNTLVHFPGEPSLIGQILPVKLTENKTFYFLGERIGNE